MIGVTVTTWDLMGFGNVTYPSARDANSATICRRDVRPMRSHVATGTRRAFHKDQKTYSPRFYGDMSGIIAGLEHLTEDQLVPSLKQDGRCTLLYLVAFLSLVLSINRHQL